MWQFRTHWLEASLLLVLFGSGCLGASAPLDPAKKQIHTIQASLERGLIRLCLGLQRAFGPEVQNGQNVVFAPLSLAAVHALLLAASNGATKKELEALFGVDNISYKQEDLHKVLSEFIVNVLKDKQVDQNLMSANGLFPQAGSQISREFEEFAKNVYQSEVIPLDYKRNSFESTIFINRWVSNRTEGKIPQVIDDLVDPTTSLIIANAFFFKGSWEQPFNPNYTKIQDFMVSKTEVLKVPMMVSVLDIPYNRQRGSHSVIGLPYKGGDVVMYFVLPEMEIRQFVDSLTFDSFLNIIRETKRQKTIVALPKMRVEGDLELSKALYSLGLRTLFNKRTAGLSALGKGSFVSEVIHKVAVEVSEWGTAAAASTSTFVHRDGSMPLFRADRPFLFFIFHHRANSILFWGTVFRPEPLH